MDDKTVTVGWFWRFVAGIWGIGRSQVSHCLSHVISLVRQNSQRESRFIRGVAQFIFFAAIFARFQAHGLESVVLTWNASPDPETAGYNIYFGGGSGNYTNMITVGNVTNTTISGLTPGVTYYFAATAYDDSGSESPYSNQTSYTPPSSPVLSLTPTLSNGRVKSVAITAGSAILPQWALESSSDLINWTIIATGTNSIVNLVLSTGGAPSQFFRLTSD